MVIIMQFMQEILNRFLDISILLFEYIGVFVIVFAGVVGIVNFARRDPLTRLKLAKGLAMGLEFKLGGEILRTVVMRELSEILLVGSIILLRAALTFLIHWEIKNEESAYGNHSPEQTPRTKKRKAAKEIPDIDPAGK